MLSMLLRRAWAVLLFVCILTGCGGGGGGGGGDSAGTETPLPAASPGSPTPPSPRYATLTGTVVKGIIGNASIRAYTLADDGSRGALLGATQSSEDGHYTLEILVQTTPVWLELSGSTTAFMVCDSLEGCGVASQSSSDSNDNGTVDFGERMPLPPGLILKALLPDAKEGRITASLSPLTHLAAALAETYPQGVDGLSIAMSNSQVANLFGLDADILATDIPDVTKTARLQSASETQRMYAVIVAAFAALAEQGDFVALLQRSASEFAGLQGQLMTRSSDSNNLSLQAWAEKALALATHLNDTRLMAAFTALKNAADIADNDTTHAAPDSNITSNELKAAKSLITDVHALRGSLDITSLTAPLPGFSPLITASETVADDTGAITRASHLGAFVAVPKMALETACDSIENFFTAYLCRNIVANKTLDQICAMTFSNLSIGGKTLCEYLNALRLPAGNGLVAELALMDGVAKIEGEHEGTTVGMRLSQGTTADNKLITLDLRGDLANDAYALSIPDGSIKFSFEDLDTFASLNHPQAINSEFDTTLDLEADQVSRFEGSGKTSINLKDEDNPLINTQLSGIFTDSVGQNANVSLGMTQEESMATVLAGNFAHPDHGQPIGLSVANSDSGTNIRLQWEGHKINVATQPARQKITLNNGGSVKISLQLQDAIEDTTGTMTYNGKPYGNVIWETGNLVVKLPNGQTASLF